MQLVAEHIRSVAAFSGVVFKDRCTAETKENCVWKGLLDVVHHITENCTVTFIYNEYDSFLVDSLNVTRIASAVFCRNAAHFLDRSHDQCLGRIAAFQLVDQHNGVFRGLHIIAVICKSAIFLQRLGSELDSVHQKHNLIGVLAVGNELSGFERRHGFAAAGRVPDVAAQTIAPVPMDLGNAIGNTACRIILIAAHDLQNAVRAVRHSIKPDQLMRHGDGQQIRCDPVPIVDRLVVGVSPVKVKVLVKFPFGAGIGKIQRFCRLHRHKNLNQGKNTGEDSLVGVFFNLIGSLCHGNTALFQLDMNDGHTVDEQHEIAAPILQHLGLACKLRLLRNLIAALTSGDLPSVVDLQGNFFSEMQHVIGIVTRDGHGFSVNKAVQLHRCAQIGDLLQNLLHFSVSQRRVVQAVDAAVVLKEDACPVVNEVRFRWVFQNGGFPSLVRQSLN